MGGKEGRCWRRVRMEAIGMRDVEWQWQRPMKKEGQRPMKKEGKRDSEKRNQEATDRDKGRKGIKH